MSVPWGYHTVTIFYVDLDTKIHSKCDVHVMISSDNSCMVVFIMLFLSTSRRDCMKKTTSHWAKGKSQASVG